MSCQLVVAIVVELAVLDVHAAQLHWKVEELAWAKLYKTVQSYVHIISCLNFTVQLTDNSMFNNLKR